MSLTPNPLPESVTAELIPEAKPVSTREDPPWTLWHVLAIAVLTMASIGLYLTLIAYATHRYLDPHTPVIEIAKRPILSVIAETLAYILILGLMVSIARQPGVSFASAVRLKWPENPLSYLAGGVALAIGLQGMAHFLPMPKELPIDRFFRTPMEAWALSLFGITFAPLLEELFFRGFLYPALARRLGTYFAIFLTAVSFAVLHAPQLGRAWGPVFVIFLVGLALTVTRAVTKSVGTSLLIHMAYNFTLTALLYIATDRFQHLDKLTQ